MARAAAEVKCACATCSYDVVALDLRPTIRNRMVLVGFMGAGKTTVGRLLAERLQRRFVDLDDCICAREGRSVAEIFRDSGEEYFRSAESACLRELVRGTAAQGGPLVIAVGGGAYVQQNNAFMLREHGFTSVFLDASVEELRRRCASEGAERPLARDENLFRQLYELRRSGYMAADLRVETDGSTPEQVVDKLLAISDEQLKA